MDENAAKRLYIALKKISEKKQRDTLIIGEVVSTTPLKIDIGNNVVLTSEFLYLGQMCRPHRVTIPHTHVIDTQFSAMSPSIGSIGGGSSTFGIAGKTFEQAQSAAAATKLNQYTVLNDDGEEKQQQISDKDLGRGKVETSILVGGQATITDDSVMITDNGHKHILPRHKTMDVHLPKSDYEDSVMLEIQPKLKNGDKVLMFAFNDFQMFYVAERIENV